MRSRRDVVVEEINRLLAEGFHSGYEPLDKLWEEYDRIVREEIKHDRLGEV